MNCVRALMYESGANIELWPIAAEHTNFLLNRTPTWANELKTPYECWFKHVPDIGKIKVFGSLAYMKIETPGQFKLDPQNKMVFIVGNTETGYLLYEPITKRLERSSNVIIDETKSFRDFNPIRYENYNDINRELIYDNGSTSIEAEANLVYALHLDAEGGIPTSYEQAINCLDRENWLKAVEAEKKSVILNNVYTVVDHLNVNSKIINTRWVFTKKRDNDSTKFKARLVVKGLC